MFTEEKQRKSIINDSNLSSKLFPHNIHIVPNQPFNLTGQSKNSIQAKQIWRNVTHSFWWSWNMFIWNRDFFAICEIFQTNWGHLFYLNLFALITLINQRGELWRNKWNWIHRRIDGGSMDGGCEKRRNRFVSTSVIWSHFLAHLS